VKLSEAEQDAVTLARERARAAGFRVPDSDSIWLRDLGLAAALTFNERRAALTAGEQAWSELRALEHAASAAGGPGFLAPQIEAARARLDRAAAILWQLERLQAQWEGHDAHALRAQVQAVLAEHEAGKTTR
jgi:hypothetical protein